MPNLANHQSNEFTIDRHDVADYFERPVETNDDHCWLWLGNIDYQGYARHGGALVHRIVWQMAGRELIKGLVLCHQCPNRNCVNPDHLRQNTQKSNIQEATMPGPRRLKDEDIAEINALLAAGYSKAQIARRKGISKPWMTKFLKGEFKYAKPIGAPKQ